MTEKRFYQNLISLLDPKKSGDHDWFLSLLDDEKQTVYEAEHMEAVMQMLRIAHIRLLLSLFALKLGAKSANAYDIDPVAVRVAIENAKDNGVDNFVCGVSDLLAGVDLEGGQYDFAMANIVADILIRMSENIADYLKVGAKLVCSGIIEGRWQDVREAMEAHGLTLCDEGSENDWKVLVFTKN